MKPWQLRILAGSLGFFLASAGLGGCEGGTSSETVGITAGMVKETAGQDGIIGSTDPGNTLELYSADFQPQSNSGFAKSVTADSAGAFAFANIPPGRYQLLAREHANGKAALLTDIAVPSGTSATATLEQTGTLAGTIPASAPGHLGIAYAPGTPFFAVADSLNSFVLKGMPAGNYTVVKTWNTVTCASGAPCAGNNQQDSVEIQIRPGENATW